MRPPPSTMAVWVRNHAAFMRTLRTEHVTLYRGVHRGPLSDHENKRQAGCSIVENERRCSTSTLNLRSQAVEIPDDFLECTSPCCRVVAPIGAPRASSRSRGVTSNRVLSSVFGRDPERSRQLRCAVPRFAPLHLLPNLFCPPSVQSDMRVYSQTVSSANFLTELMSHPTSDEDTVISALIRLRKLAPKSSDPSSEPGLLVYTALRRHSVTVFAQWVAWYRPVHQRRLILQTVRQSSYCDWSCLPF